MPLASQRESNRINGLSWGHLSKVCGLALRSRSRSMRGRRMSMDESGGGDLTNLTGTGSSTPVHQAAIWVLVQIGLSER